MQDSKENTSFDPLHELTWLGENEKTLSEKLLLVLGGITSLGALFPFIFKSINVDHAQNAKICFIIFITLYLVLPAIILYLWLYMTDRFDSANRLGLNIKDFFSAKLISQLIKKPDESMPALGIAIFYKMLKYILLTHIFLGLIISLTAFIDLKIATLFGIVAYIISVIIICNLIIWNIYNQIEGYYHDNYFEKAPDSYIKTFRKTKTNVTCWLITISVVSLICIAVIIAGYNYKEPVQVDNKNFQQIVATEKLVKNLRGIEKNTKNTVDRYYLKSKLAFDNAKILLADSVESKIHAALKQKFRGDAAFNRCKRIDSYLKFFNALLLRNDSLNFNLKDKDSVINKWVTDKKWKQKEIVFDKTELKDIKATNYYKLFSKTLALSNSDSACYCDTNFIKPVHVFYACLIGRCNDDQLPYISNIESAVDSMLKNDDQLITAGHLVTSVFDSTIMVNNKFQYSIENKTIYKNYLAAFINLENSLKLYNWIDDFIAYSQRKTQSEINKSHIQAINIWSTSQKAGTVILIFTAIILALFYAAIYNLQQIASTAGRLKLHSLTTDYNLYDENKEDYNKEEKENKIIKDITGNVREIKFYLFPITAFLAILIALIIPFIKEIKQEQIEFMKPGWMYSIPNWNLTAAAPLIFDDLTPDRTKCPCDNPPVPTMATDHNYDNRKYTEINLQPVIDKIDNSTSRIIDSVNTTSAGINKNINNTRTYLNDNNQSQQ